jgi:uncharacterized protein (UPF0262 family)
MDSFFRDRIELEKLFQLKKEGKLKPLEEFSRDELKYIVGKELATVSDLAELFDVPKNKITKLKEEKMIRDLDLIEESNFERTASICQMELSDVKNMIRETLEENSNEELMEILMEKMDIKIKNNKELFSNLILNKFYWSEQETEKQ